jgi:hypothetical protein
MSYHVTDETCPPVIRKILELYSIRVLYGKSVPSWLFRISEKLIVSPSGLQKEKLDRC